MWFIIAPILATIITLIGTWLLGDEIIFGWYLHICGTILWVIYSLTLDQIGMAFACAAYFYPEIRGIIKWNKKEQS